MSTKILDFRCQNQDFSASMLGRGFRTQLGLVLEAKLGSSWSQVAPKSAQGGARGPKETRNLVLGLDL